MDTKNVLITQLKEQIVEVTRIRKKKEDKQLINSEIDQLKDLITQLTTQMGRPVDQESECTEVDDCDHHPSR